MRVITLNRDQPRVAGRLRHHVEPAASAAVMARCLPHRGPSRSLSNRDFACRCFRLD